VSDITFSTLTPIRDAMHDPNEEVNKPACDQAGPVAATKGIGNTKSSTPANSRFRDHWRELC
jgi:hypothetical protein